MSIATVSRVYNNQSLVSPQTTQLILKIADELEYVPNSAARNLIMRRTHTLGVLLPDLYGEFYSELIRGIELVAHRHGFQILLSSSFHGPEDIVMASKAMLGRIDGVIMMSPDKRSMRTAEKISGKVPVVLLNPGEPIEGCHVVAVDNFAGARAATKHLLDLGHRRLAMVAGPEDNIDALDRQEGFRRALIDAGLDPEEALVIPGDFRELSGFKAARVIMGQDPRPTAVFAANDGMAIGLMAALQDKGLALPDDMAVVGFDDITLAGFVTPPLTTVKVDAGCLGGRAVEIMLETLDMEETAPTQRVVLPAHLKVRSSCGIPAGRDHFSRRPWMEPEPHHPEKPVATEYGDEEVQP